MRNRLLDDHWVAVVIAVIIRLLCLWALLAPGCAVAQDVDQSLVAKLDSLRDVVKQKAREQKLGIFASVREIEVEAAIRTPNESEFPVDLYGAVGVKADQFDFLGAYEREDGEYYSEMNFTGWRSISIPRIWDPTVEVRMRYKEARQINRQVILAGWEYERVIVSTGVTANDFSDPRWAGDLKFCLPGGHFRWTLAYGSAPTWDVVTSFDLVDDKKIIPAVEVRYFGCGKQEFWSSSLKIRFLL